MTSSFISLLHFGEGIDHQIYLALSQLVYQANFDETIDIVVKENQIKLIIVDTEKEVITKWIN